MRGQRRSSRQGIVMGLSEGIRKHGFRKWYERELLQSHGHMVLLLLCAISLLGAFEVFERKASTGHQLSIAVSVVLSVLIGLWALRRYLRLLMQAEAVARQAECAVCGVYGRLVALSGGDDLDCVNVRCRRCGHLWPIWT